jgi:uncharacterized protein YlxW (UPF0749 family)
LCNQSESLPNVSGSWFLIEARNGVTNKTWVNNEASRATELSRERKFRRRAELSDLARKYRKLNAELDPTNENSARLSEFYISEGRLIDDEMRDLDNSM